MDPNTRKQTTSPSHTTTMSTSAVTETQLVTSGTTVIAGPPKIRKLKPARKQVKAGEVEKKEAPQTGKEYSA